MTSSATGRDELTKDKGDAEKGPAGALDTPPAVPGKEGKGWRGACRREAREEGKEWGSWEPRVKKGAASKTPLRQDKAAATASGDAET